MSEIEKLMENAGIKKKVMCEWTCKDSDVCSTNCEHHESIKEYYPTFTEHKQLELIKWLLKKKIDLTMNFAFMGNEFHISTDRFTCSFAKTFKTALARLINNLWKDLTEEEKEEIKEILNG